MDYKVSEPTVIEAELALESAMLESDVKALNELLSDDLVFTMHTGTVIGKNEDIEAHRTQVFKIHGLKTSDRILKCKRSFAVVSSKVEIDGEIQGQRATETFRFTRVWERSDNGTLKVVAGQSTLIEK
jgi:ketosteroid isomerase-like protein